ncbi:MAG: hypothetical protein Q4B43_06880 [Bacteroidota bacterium]|nr:hypothetical protein [Bacteroidota bacterium]
MKKIILSISTLLLVSCNFGSKNQSTDSEVLARVGGKYLYASELNAIIPIGSTSEDSLIIKANYMKKWATQNLLIEASEEKLSSDKKNEFEELVAQYKADLYIKAYLEHLVKEQVDTVVTTEQLKAYYDQNKEHFKTTLKLVKIRYINVPKQHQKIDEIKQKFINFSKNDQKNLDTYLVQFNGAALNDSVWVDVQQVYQKIPFINPKNEANYLQRAGVFEHTEDDNLYLVKVNAVLQENEVSPFDYIQETIKNVIINKRKQQFIEKLEQNILEEALKNKSYETYK